VSHDELDPANPSRFLFFFSFLCRYLCGAWFAVGTDPEHSRALSGDGGMVGGGWGASVFFFLRGDRHRGQGWAFVSPSRSVLLLGCWGSRLGNYEHGQSLPLTFCLCLCLCFWVVEWEARARSATTADRRKRRATGVFPRLLCNSNGRKASGRGRARGTSNRMAVRTDGRMDGWMGDGRDEAGKSLSKVVR
jgi:hypothetical protein